MSFNCEGYHCTRYAWHSIIPSFAHRQNELHALSQYDDTTYYPNVYQYKTTIQRKVEEFFTEHVSDALKDFENYIIDFFVAPEKVSLVLVYSFPVHLIMADIPGLISRRIEWGKVRLVSTICACA